MHRDQEADEAKIAIAEPHEHAAGIPGVTVALKRSVRKMGLAAGPLVRCSSSIRPKVSTA